MIASLLKDFDRIKAKLDEYTKASKFIEVDGLLRSNAFFFMEIIEALRKERDAKTTIDIVKVMVEATE